MMETITNFSGTITATVFVMSNVNGHYFWYDTYNWYNQGSGIAPVIVITTTKLKLNLKCNIPVLVTIFSKVKLEDVGCIFSTYLCVALYYLADIFNATVS